MEKRNWFIAALGKNRLLSQPPVKKQRENAYFSRATASPIFRMAVTNSSSEAAKDNRIH